MVTAMVTTISMVANNILMCCRFYGYLEITTEFGDGLTIGSFGSNLEMQLLLLEIAILFGD